MAFLGRHDEAHVGVLAVTVEVIATALPERDDLAVKAGCVLWIPARSASSPCAGPRTPPPATSCRSTAALTRSVTSSIDQRICTSRSGHLSSSASRGGVEAVAHQVVLLRAQFVELVGADVVVRDDQTIGRHERARCADMHARFLQVLKPFRRRLEAVFGLELLDRRMVSSHMPSSAEQTRCRRGNESKR